MRMRTVGETMTPRPVVLPPDATVDRALHVARAKGIHHLLVDCDDGLARVVCLCDLLERESLDDALDGSPRRLDSRKVIELAHRRTFVVGPDDTLEDAADLMSREGIGCLPVMKNGEIVGVITREDLLERVEASEVVLDARCASCGSTQDVRRVEPGAAGFCAKCWSRSVPARDDEIGVGD